MINPDQIEEWIQEVEQRPSSAALIIQYISNRLRDLTERNEELLAENIELRTGRKVEEYESRIAQLEYQLGMLQRQFNGDISLTPPPQEAATLTIILYNTRGQVFRLEQPVETLISGTVLATVQDIVSGGPARLLVTHQAEELLFVFDSGRTVALPAQDIPAVAPQAPLGWAQAYLIEPRGGEELATVLPIARMSLYDFCIQTSRRGCAKRMMKTSFESHVSKNFVGSGIKSKPDKTCDLIFSGKEDLLILVSHEGFLDALDVSQLPYTAEEVIKMGPTDYITASFIAGNKPSLLVVTQNGKVIHRDTGWVEKAASFKTRGQPVFSQTRRESGTRVAGAATVNQEEWAVSVVEDGRILLHSIADLIRDGTLFTGPFSSEPEPRVLEFTCFESQKPVKNEPKK